MSSLRHLWFDSRHLLGDGSGQVLLAELDAIGPRSRETILSIGDRLAAISLTLAQVFCRHAPAAWRIFGAKEFARWVRVGEHLAGEEPASRDGATAFFSLDPQKAAAVGLDAIEEWAAIGRETLTISRRLGTQFLQTSAPLLALLPQPLAPRLRAWATHGSALLGAKGWKGEFLAVSYFEAAPVALPVLGVDEMAEWAKLGLLVQDSGPWTFYLTLPSGFAGLTASERLALLTSCQQAASLSPKAAADIFFRLPPVLLLLAPVLRPFILALLAPVMRTDPAAVSSLLPLLVPVTNVIGLLQREWLREQLIAVAQEFPPGVVPLVRSLPRALEEAGEQGLARWLAKGRKLARAHASAGVAFFAIESRTSFKVLRQASTGVDLEEVQELLRKYIHMLSGRSVGIARQDALSYPPPLEPLPAVGDALPLPARIDVFPTYEENFRLFRLLAVQQAARRGFGTYDFSLRLVWPRLSAGVRQLVSDEEEAEPEGNLVDYFGRFPHPDIIEALFVVIETERVSAKIRQTYYGLGADIEWMKSCALPSAFPETLMALWPRLGLRVPAHASVYDSAVLAAEAYAQLFSAIEPGRQVRDPAAFSPLLLDKVTGDALIDAEFGYEDERPPPQAPDLPQLALDPERDDREGGTPLSPEELKALLDAGVDLHIRQGKSDAITPQGLYISDLSGKLPGEAEKQSITPDDGVVVGAQRRREREEGLTFFYDEWDYHISDYRSRWCRVREIVLAGDAGEYFAKTLHAYSALTPAVKHEFQRIRPEQYRLMRGLEDGEEFDLNAVVTAASDIRARIPPSPKLYTMRRQTERDVAALFLLDMSASTDEPIVPVVREYIEGDSDDWAAAWKKRPVSHVPQPRRIIDVTKEAVVLMAAALEEIGDAYAIYGFSGQGRENVEFYQVKSFSEMLSPTVKGRIGAIEPKRSTRMGAALRHALEKMKDVACRVKLLVLLSDGFPQDMDYGFDRRSITYGIRDTMTALREADRAGVLTFCLTVDKAGHDYLREMCEPSRYLVLEDVASLPLELPKVYQRYIRPRGT